MPISTEQRAEINRQNATRSTGPRTEAGKAVSRGNALKHGLAATTIAPVRAPGEPAGAYQARLDVWVGDLQPRNVLELAMVERACRASWKLDRCARYEDAAATLRETVNDSQADPNSPNRRNQAKQLGTLLMFQLDFDPYPMPNRPLEAPSLFDDAPGHVDVLCRFKEGVEWLLDAWDGVLPNLPTEGGPPLEGSDEFLHRTRLRALRLLGVPTGAPPPAQPLRDAGAAEVRRLRALLAGMSSENTGQIDADLALFNAGPEAQLLMRYESQAERELHRAVNTFLKLRKDPDLIPPPEPEPRPEPAPAAEVAPTVTPPAAPSRPAARTEPPPARNEASPADRPSRPTAVPTSPAGRKMPLYWSP